MAERENAENVAKRGALARDGSGRVTYTVPGVATFHGGQLPEHDVESWVAECERLVPGIKAAQSRLRGR